jgi:hypothetical protein
VNKSNDLIQKIPSKALKCYFFSINIVKWSLFRVHLIKIIESVLNFQVVNTFYLKCTVQWGVELDTCFLFS